MNDVNLTGGGDKEKRRKLDFYPTPPDVTLALMHFLHMRRCHPVHVWEPACGDGAMSKIMEAYGVNRVVSTDIRHTGYGVGGIDFLSKTTYDDDPFHAIITNPPFKQSQEFILKALEHAPVVAMLLKSQYWHASKRTLLFAKRTPAYVLPLNWRPDFMGGERGGSPTMECAWNVWIAGEADTRYKVLTRPSVPHEYTASVD